MEEYISVKYDKENGELVITIRDTETETEVWRINKTEYPHVFSISLNGRVLANRYSFFEKSFNTAFEELQKTLEICLGVAVHNLLGGV